MKTELNMQDTFLNIARQERRPVTVFLMNGFQFRGHITGFDSFVVLMDVEGRQNMIYKHAISTVIPQGNISLFPKKGGKDTV
jgi:host factor-I protein